MRISSARRGNFCLIQFKLVSVIQNWLMRLGAKFKLLSALTIAIHFTGFRFARVFYNFYSFTIQARSQFSTLPRKKSWLAWASQHALILGNFFNKYFSMAALR